MVEKRVNRRKYCDAVFSPFPTMFSKSFLFQCRRNSSMCGEWLNNVLAFPSCFTTKYSPGGPVFTDHSQEPILCLFVLDLQIGM